MGAVLNGLLVALFLVQSFYHTDFKLFVPNGVGEVLKAQEPRDEELRRFTYSIDERLICLLSAPLVARFLMRRRFVSRTGLFGAGGGCGVWGEGVNIYHFCICM